MNDSERLSPPAAVHTPEVISETIQFVQPTDSVTFVPNSLSPGTPLGHYVIKKYIGGGGMGRVYLATDAALDRDVAIKILSQQRATDRDTVARFMNEAKSAARLNHEHIAQVYFADEESGIPYIAFEYVEGINVRTMVEEHDVLPLPQALNYLLQIAHALDHAAGHGVIHRDVKPSNILITREGRAKLIDMGLARLLDTSEARNDLTASGVTLGTFDYISPEQARDPRNADIRSDIYSLGCTFFFMLAGRPPFPEGTVLQKLLQHQGDVPPDIRSFQPTIPAEIAFLVQKMMAKDPKQRFQTPTVLIEAMKDVAHRLGLRQAGQGNLVWTPARSHRTSFLLRHAPWITAISLLLFGFLLMTFFSEQFEMTLFVPNMPEPIPLIVSPKDTISPPVEPAIPVTSTFDIAFIPYSDLQFSRYSIGVGTSVVSGSLQPTPMVAEHLSKPIMGGFCVTDFDPKKPSITAQQTTKSHSDVRCVDPTGNTIGSYTSLVSALTDAEDGTVIELKWNNAHRVMEQIQINCCKLQLVAAEGYDPILLFEPSESQSIRSFCTVFSSSLEFRHVGIEMRLNPSVLSSHWSLFESAGNVQLTFEECCLTVQNRSILDNAAYHEDVVFFRNSVPTGGIFSDDNIEESISGPLTIQMTDSLLRGEAVAIQNDVLQDIHVQLSNSLVALVKPFILIDENRRATKKKTTIQIRWDRVAFFGRQGIVSLYKKTVGESMVIDFESQQSVFVLNRSFFAVFRGSQSQQEVLDNFRWSIGTDFVGANYFQGVSGLRFRPLSSFKDSGIDSEMSLAEWQHQWTQDTKDQTKIDTLTLSEIVKPVSHYVPTDVRVILDATNRVLLPDLGWFPTRWHND